MGPAFPPPEQAYEHEALPAAVEGSSLYEGLPSSAETSLSGEQCLELVGQGHLADRPIPGYPGLTGRDFWKICEHALPAFVALRDMSPDDPIYSLVYGVLEREVITRVAPETLAEG